MKRFLNSNLGAAALNGAAAIIWAYNHNFLIAAVFAMTTAFNVLVAMRTMHRD